MSEGNMNLARKGLEKAMRDTFEVVPTVTAVELLNRYYDGHPIVQGRFSVGCGINYEPHNHQDPLRFTGHIGPNKVDFAIFE